MRSQVCPHCQAEVSPMQTTCHRCGARLTSTALVPVASQALVPVRPGLPAPLRQAVRPVVALTIASLGLRLARAWLRARPPRALSLTTRRKQHPAPQSRAEETETASQLIVIERTVRMWVLTTRRDK